MAGNKLCQMGTWTLRAVLALCFLSAVLTALPLLLGLKGCAVISGSMEPAIHKGAAIYIKKTGFSGIRENTVITYQLGEGSTLVTHRVVKVNEKRRTFVTKGDANEKPDKKEVAFSQVKGAVVFSLPGAGYLMRAFSDPWRRLLLLSVFWLLLSLEEGTKRAGEGKRDGMKKETWIHG